LNCRICSGYTRTIIDLGISPPANSLLDNTRQSVCSYPLVLEYCNSCCNIQLRDCLDSRDLYKNYLYVTPDSKMLNEHYEYLTRFLLSNKYINSDSKVLEIGSNIGLYLNHIRPFVKEILGVDPAENIAKLANAKGVHTICEFFSKELAMDLRNSKGKVDTIIARHCFAHNASPHDLLKGVKVLLDEGGVFVIENAYALNTIENNEFDQIYHEHMFYYSIQSMTKVLEMNGFKLIDILISLVHGGSIVFIAKHISSKNSISNSLRTHLQYEKEKLNMNTLARFSSNAFTLKEDLLKTINAINQRKETIYSYGATAKGNTLLNFLGLDNSIIKYCVDSTSIKQGKYLPGSKIKIINEDFKDVERPDYFLLTAWNYKDEIITKVRNKGNKDSAFIVPFPTLHII